MRTNIVTKEDISKIWLKKVLNNLGELENKIIYSLEHQSIDEKIITDYILELQQHYTAISNLKKAFNDNTYFVGNYNEN